MDSSQPAYTKVRASDQPVIINADQTKQSTSAQTLGVGSTGVKENCGSHLSYISLARRQFPSSSLFRPRHSHLEPPPPFQAAAATHRRSPPPRPRPRRCSPPRSPTAVPSRRRAPSRSPSAARAHLLRPRAPPCSSAAVLHASTPSTPQTHAAAAAPRRSRIRCIFSPGAR